MTELTHREGGGLGFSCCTFLGDEYLLTLFFIYSDFSYIIYLHAFQTCFKLTAILRQNCYERYFEVV